MKKINTRAEFKAKNGNSPTFSETNHLLVIGCNYHTTWQTHKNMRFVLTELRGDKARLQTRSTGRDFWTNTKDLLWVNTKHNRNKAKEYLRDDKNTLSFVCISKNKITSL